MVNWARLTAIATGTADRVFCEPVRLSFFKGGAADPDRPPADISAQVHLPGEADAALAKGNKVFATSIVAGSGLVIIQKSRWAGVLMQGDKIRADRRDGQPWLEVTAVDGSSPDQIVATVSTVGKRT